LLQQFLWNLIRCRSDDYAVVGPVLAPAFPAVSGPELHVVDIEIAQSLPGLAQQFGNSLHRVDLLHERRQHGGLVAAAGTNLEHRFTLEAIEQGFGHTGHHVGLANRLSEANG
jgi:hypothetical protein